MSEARRRREPEAIEREEAWGGPLDRDELGPEDGSDAGELIDGSPAPEETSEPRRRRRFGSRGRAPRGAAAVAAVPASAATARPAATPAERPPYVDDPVSKIWVAIVIGALSLLLLNAIFLGRGGILTPLASRSPTATAGVSIPPSPGDESPAASPTDDATVSPGPTRASPRTPSPTASP